MKGVVIQQLGPVTYTVEVEGKLLKCHVDRLRQWIDSASPPVTSVNAPLRSGQLHIFRVIP